MKIILDVIKASDLWTNHKFSYKNAIKKIANYSLQHILGPSADGKVFELSVLLTNDKDMQNFNNNFLQKDYPTNVLSFPTYEAADLKQIIEEEAYIHLGDIAVGYEKIHSEALAANIAVENHFTHLMIHAILHLLGFDHIEDDMAIVMETKEVEILKKFNIKSPY